MPFEEAKARLRAVKDEDDFLGSILLPLFLTLGFEYVTKIHHTGQPERGKDMVFFQRDRLGNFTTYAVVACREKIHTNSSKITDAGHVAKLQDQVRKCFGVGWRDPHLKRTYFIDKVVIATPSTITPEAMEELLEWEQTNKRQLIYLSFEQLVSLMAGSDLD